MSCKTQTGAAASPSSQSVIFYLLCAGFVINGIVISLIGPILPMFMAKWGLNDSRAGLFSLVQFSGSFIGVLASSALISAKGFKPAIRSEEHTSELQSRGHLVCRLLLEKKKKNTAV